MYSSFEMHKAKCTFRKRNPLFVHKSILEHSGARKATTFTTIKLEHKVNTCEEMQRRSGKKEPEILNGMRNRKNGENNASRRQG